MCHIINANIIICSHLSEIPPYGRPCMHNYAQRAFARGVITVLSVYVCLLPVSWFLFACSTRQKTLHIQFCSIPLKRRLRFSSITMNSPFLLPSRAGCPRSSFRRRAARSQCIHALGAARGRVSKLKFKIVISAVCHCYCLPSLLSGSSLPSAIANDLETLNLELLPL